MLLSKMVRTALMLVPCALLAPCPVNAQTSWHLEKTLKVGGAGGMDYITVEPETQRLFVTRSTHTLVLDANTGKTLGDIGGQQRSHGVAIVPRLGRGFITDGGAGAIVVFDLKSYQVLGTLKALPDADGIIYDAGTDTVLVSAGDSNSLITFKPDVDPKTGKIDAPIALGGAPEFLAGDGAGKAYVNLEDKDVVAVVDLKTRTVVARWPVAPGGKPVGLSLDAAHHTLFVGCRKPQKMIALSTESGKVLADLPIGAGVDATATEGTEAFASSGDGTLTVVHRAGGEKFTADTVKTERGAKTLAVDTTSGRIYLPTFDYEAPKAGADRPNAVPGSFKILVVSR